MKYSRHHTAVLLGLLHATVAAFLLSGVAHAQDEFDAVQVESGVMGSAFRDRSPTMTVVCPDGEVVEGVDVSQWQGTIDWTSVENSGREFVFIRVADGGTSLDTQFDSNWAGAQSAGLIRGPYQFFRASEDPVVQADFLLLHVSFAAGDLPPVLDVGTLDGESPATVILGIQAWAHRIVEVSGLAPIIYTGAYFWDFQLGNPDLSERPLWTAHWGAACPLVPGVWSDWAFWQYSSEGVIPGISGNANLNIFNGSLSDLEDFIESSDTTLLFADGFESGDTSKWSAVVP